MSKITLFITLFSMGLTPLADPCHRDENVDDNQPAKSEVPGASMVTRAESSIYVKPSGRGLAELARERNKYFGANFSSPYWGWNWQQNPPSTWKSIYATDATGRYAGYEPLAIDHFNILCGGNDAFWIQDDLPSVANGTYNFGSVDALLSWMGEHGIAYHGVGLGYIQRGKFTKWRQGKSQYEIRDMYTRYVQKKTQHFKGRVFFYDAINEHAGFKASFRGDPYYNTYVSHKHYPDLNMFGHLESFLDTDQGEVYAIDYYRTTLDIAHCIDPGVQLAYLDYNNEITGSKSNVMYRTAKALLEEGAPLHGLGTQLHTSSSFSYTEPENEGNPWLERHHLPPEEFVNQMRENMKRFSDLGLEIYATEVSVRASHWHENDTALFAAKRAYVYRKLVEVFLEFPGYRVFKMWGVTGNEGIPQGDPAGQQSAFGQYLFDKVDGSILANSAFYAVQDAFEHYHPEVVAKLDSSIWESDSIVLTGASMAPGMEYNGAKSIHFTAPGDQLLLEVDLEEYYNPHLSYYWLLESLPHDKPFAVDLSESLKKEVLAIEVSADGETWNRVRTYNEDLLKYRMVEISPWHAGYTTLVGMDEQKDIRIRFIALEGMQGESFYLSDLELIADDRADNGDHTYLGYPE